MISIINMVLYGLETILVYAFTTYSDGWMKKEQISEFVVYIIMFFLCVYYAFLILSFYNQIKLEKICADGIHSVQNVP